MSNNRNNTRNASQIKQAPNEDAGRNEDGNSAPDNTQALNNVDLNSPTVTGFPASDPGVTSPQEANGLRRLTLDDATKLRAGLDQVVGYQTGVVYRQDFTAGLDTLRTFGFAYDVEKADADATAVQDAVVAHEAETGPAQG